MRPRGSPGKRHSTSTARRYYAAAGEAGHAKALHNLAVLHAEGIDGKADYPAVLALVEAALPRGERGVP